MHLIFNMISLYFLGSEVERDFVILFGFKATSITLYFTSWRLLLLIFQLTSKIKIIHLIIRLEPPAELRPLYSLLSFLNLFNIYVFSSAYACPDLFSEAFI